MKKTILRICALVLALCLPATSTLAELGWVDAGLAHLVGTQQDTAFSLGFRINSLLPFGQETLDMLNETLDHIRVESRICGDDARMAFCVDGESLFTIEEARQGERMGLRTSLLPNRLLVADASPMDALSGNEMAQEKPFDLHAAIRQVDGLWQDVAEAIVPFATEKAANYKISGIGYGRWVRLAKLSPEDSAGLLPRIIAVLGCGMDEGFRARLAELTCGDGFTIALYSDGEGGTPLALYMKGSVTLAQEEKWTLAYQYAFAEEDGQRTDTYRFELEKSQSPRHMRFVEAKLASEQTETGLSLTRECKLTIKDDILNEVVTNKDSLKAIRSGNRLDITGTLETTVKDQSTKEPITTTTTILPALALTSAEGAGVLSGTVSLEEMQGKKPLRSLALLFDEEPARALEAAQADGSLFAVAGADPLDASVAGSSLAQNTDVVWTEPDAYLVGTPPLGLKEYTAPAAPVTVDMDTAEPGVKAALLDEMAQNAAGVLLTALASLPGESLTLLTDNMTAEDYQTFLSLLGDM